MPRCLFPLLGGSKALLQCTMPPCLVTWGSSGNLCVHPDLWMLGSASQTKCPESVWAFWCLISLPRQNSRVLKTTLPKLIPDHSYFKSGVLSPFIYWFKWSLNFNKRWDLLSQERISQTCPARDVKSLLHFFCVCCCEGQMCWNVTVCIGLVDERTLAIVTAAVINQKPMFWIILSSIWIYNGHSCLNQQWITHVAGFWVWDFITTSEWTV